MYNLLTKKYIHLRVAAITMMGSKVQKLHT